MKTYETPYEKFQRSKHELADGTLVYDYGNSTLEINLNTEYSGHGKYALTIERDYWVSDDLEELEDLLYQWAKENL
jgi:hypothetical protein